MYITVRALHPSYKSRAGVVAVGTLVLSLAACSHADLPEKTGLASQSADAPHRHSTGGTAWETEPPIPPYQSVIAAPSAPELADTRRVSIAVTETVPLRDVLIELARRAEVDLELDPRISGGIIMSATDRPFIEVIERIAALAELRYRLNRNVLRIEIDDTYLEQYRMDVLNQVRTSTGTVTSSTDPSSSSQAVGSGGGRGGNNKSSTSISWQSQNNFWASISTSISQILSSIQSRRGQPIRDAGTVYTPAAGPSIGLTPTPSRTAPVLPLTQASAGPAPGVPAANPSPIPTAMTNTGATRTAVASGNFNINPQAGTITVFANRRQHQLVEKYLRTVRNQVNLQVLVEAKVLEVALDDQYRAGINWQALIGPGFISASGARLESIEVNTNFTRSVVPADYTNPTVTGVFRNSDQDLNLAAQLVKAFGSVRTLSSPRLTVTNNQAAVLKVARNQVFFDLAAEREQNTIVGRGDRVAIESQIKSVPVGLVMNVQPVIDPVSRRISMSLRPSFTRITGFVADPAVAITVAQINANGNAGANVSSQIPIIEVREMDSVISLASGETVVMGGLMQESGENNREGLPGAMDLPLIGPAVSQNIKANRVTELVIFIRATIVDGGGSVAPEDIRLYQTFTPDPRPLAF